MRLIDEYLRLGLDLGRHIDGFVDAYYGPPEPAQQAAAASPVAPDALVARAKRLLADLEIDGELDANRRNWLAAQVRGLYTTARKLAGEDILYLDEIEASYGVRPSYIDEEELAAAHRDLDEVLPQTGAALAERYIAWREQQVIPPEKLGQVINSLADDFRERTARAFGLPEGEHVDFELVTNKPWGGFNYYLGGLRSRVAINTDLPVLSLAIGHLVAHEAYPGHHTEHSRKEVGLVNRRQQREECIFLVGTPQCLIAEGLADLGLEVVTERHPEPVVESHVEPLGIPYDAEVAARVGAVGEKLGSVRGNAAIGLHDRGWSQDEAIAYVQKWSLTTEPRAAKSIEFLTDPTWRAYPFCYIDGVRLCRSFVGGDPARFERLLAEQLVPSQLVAA